MAYDTKVRVYCVQYVPIQTWDTEVLKHCKRVL